jgi:hypothetical protein
MLSLDALMSSAPSAFPTTRDAATINNPQKQNTTPSDPTLAVRRDSDSRTNTSACSCVYNTLRVVQQLDDDAFNITSLSLDQVLQLQKWIMSQCHKPLDCPNCNLLSTVYTVLVIICDRLAEMFECIHKRIKKSSQRLSGQGVSSDQGSSNESWAPSSSGITERPEQLYCTSSKGLASKANCNPVLFSPDFKSMYSEEEQVHMIGVLLKLQMRNFRTLLARVHNASQTGANEARRARVKSIMIRLMKAETDIDNALRVVLHTFTVD